MPIEAPTPGVPAETAAAAEVAVTAVATVDVPAPAVTDGAVAPRVYGQANTDSRVQLRAIEESWIQITGPGNELLLTRILKPGDVYLVPNRPGIVMMTGNAGGLEVALDGEVLPPIGPAGAVRRNIALDPEALRAHQASSQSRGGALQPRAVEYQGSMIKTESHGKPPFGSRPLIAGGRQAA